MADTQTAPVNKGYIIGVSILTFVMPVVSAAGEFLAGDMSGIVASLGKWFIFYAVGIRLTLAGIRQIRRPGFTAREIFHIESGEVYPIVRELGFANLCAGLVAIIALFCPSWRIVSAFGSGLYYGIAGIYHLVRRPSGTNEQFAMVTDLLICLLLAAYIVIMR
jgi:hypothetical protein